MRRGLSTSSLQHAPAVAGEALQTLTRTPLQIVSEVYSPLRLLRKRRERKRGKSADPQNSSKWGGGDGGDGGGGGGGSGGSSGGSGATRGQAIVVTGVTGFLMWWLLWSNRSSRQGKEISWQVFRDTIVRDPEQFKQIEKLKVIAGYNRALVKVYMADMGYTYFFTTESADTLEVRMMTEEVAMNIMPSDRVRIEHDNRIELTDLAPVLGWALWVLVFIRSARAVRSEIAGAGAQAASGKDKFKPVMQSKARFRDVAGMEEPKREIQEFVDFMKFPDRFTKLGAKVPSGAILFGPPGTGKTLLAKAIAGESGVPFYSVCGADFVEMYVGVGASRVRELFAAARKHPRAIIYIDEIDAVGRKRGGSLMSGGSSERENTLNQLLIEMDGFKKADGKIIVIASTNVNASALDDALLRPGRFDRQVYIDLPTVKEREHIFGTHLETINLVPTFDYENSARVTTDETIKEAEQKKRTMLGLPPLNDEKKGAEKAAPPRVGRGRVTIKATEQPEEEAFGKQILPNSARVKAKISNRMAQMSPGFSGADIANICNEGALIAARQKRAFVDMECMEKAVDRVIGGIEKRSRVMSPFEKKAVAYHEAGHAVVGWFLESCDPLMKVSIVPRGSAALGYAQYLPSERKMQSYQQIFDQMCMTLGGRCSELYHFKHLSTGAQDDLSKVTRSAYTAVATFGMARNKLGSVVSYAAPGTSDTNVMKPYSDEVAQVIDEEAKVLVDKAFKRTMELIHEKRAEIEIVGEHLLKNEVITRQDFIDLIGPRPFEEEDVPPPVVCVYIVIPCFKYHIPHKCVCFNTTRNFETKRHK